MRAREDELLSLLSFLASFVYQGPLAFLCRPHSVEIRGCPHITPAAGGGGEGSTLPSEHIQPDFSVTRLFAFDS